MIDSITIENFKSLKKVTLKLGRLNLFIGTNASGKSNFLDALRVIQGIGYGFTFHEILDGKPKGAASEVWDGIRGGSQRALCSTCAPADPVRFRLGGSLEEAKKVRDWSYQIAFSAVEGRAHRECLAIEGQDVYTSSPVLNRSWDVAFKVRYYSKSKRRPIEREFEKNRPVLAQFARATDGLWEKADAELAGDLAQLLSDTQKLDPSPALLHGYSQAHEIRRLGEHGENFAALINTICADPQAKEAYLSWLKELRPREVDDVGTLSGAVGEPLFMLKENGREYPAPVLSDGTLRFAAVAAAFFQPDMPRLLTIEEIESGIHPSRVRLMVELLRSRSSEGHTQVLVTSHSPYVLAWLKPEEYETTFLCRRDDETGESRICPLTEIPHFAEAVKNQSIGDLFAEGWMETAL